jgi:GNAT superfamily N-acetyltransferase
MSNVMIRKARESDWDAFRSFLEHDQPVDSLEAAFKRFQKKLESPLHVVLVAELNGEIVGIAKAHEWDEYLMSGIKQIRFSSLAVSESHRRQGIGRALFEATRDWAESQGATWFEWYASKKAVPFYESLGFKGQSQPDEAYPYFCIEYPLRPS